MMRSTVRRPLVLLGLAAVGALALTGAASEFTVVLIPDTQYYSLNTPGTYNRQTQWMATNRTAENIRFAIHLGDITHENTDTEWQRARAAHNTLDNAGLRYSMVPGNHDYVRVDAKVRRNTNRYNYYFGPQRFIPRNAYGGAYNRRNDNNFMLFENDDLRFMVVSLEFAPTKDAMCWADSVIARHPDRRVIVATHCYLDKDGNYQGDCATKYNTVGASGQELFDELIAKHSTIFMVVAGHVYGASHTARSRPHFGDVVHEMLVDYQNENYVGPLSPTPSPESPNGNGWLRTLRFLPAQNKIRARTFTVNPWVTRFNRTVYDPLPTDPDHAFELDYDMQAPIVYRSHAGSGEFRDRTVNPVSSGDQWLPAVAADQAGNFLVAWEDDTDENTKRQIHARGFDANGCERTSRVAVNFTSSGQQREPAVAMSPDGRAVVVWADDKDGNGSYQIYGKGYTPSGQEHFVDRGMNAVAAGDQRRPAVASDAAGNFVAAWDDTRNGVSHRRIMARGFRPDGTVRFSEIDVTEGRAGAHRAPTIAMRPNGAFVVVWEDDENVAGVTTMHGRLFGADGTAGNSFTVASIAGRWQRTPSVAIRPNGDFVVTWVDSILAGTRADVRARVYHADGTPQTDAFTVNSDQNGYQRRPKVAVEASGKFVVVWQDDRDMNGSYQVHTRSFAADGTPLPGSERAVNLDSSGQQRFPGLALLPNGKMVVVWEDDLDGNTHEEILARGLSARF